MKSTKTKVVDKRVLEVQRFRLVGKSQEYNRLDSLLKKTTKKV